MTQGAVQLVWRASLDFDLNRGVRHREPISELVGNQLEHLLAFADALLSDDNLRAIKPEATVQTWRS